MKLAKRSLAIVVGTTLLSSGTVVGQRRYEPNAPDSFLRFQVDSTKELVAVLKSDPVLRRRFARHFGVSESEIVDFVERALIPYRLPRSRTVTVYGVTKTGRVYPVRSRLRKGTRVWATRSGVPILKWLCANPFTKTLPGTQLTDATPAVPEAGFRGGQAGLLPVAALETSPLLPGVTSVPGIPTPLSGGGSALLPITALPAAPSALAFLPLAFLGIPINNNNNVTPQAEIPEPATLALMAAGLPLLVGMGVRRRRREIEG